MNSSETISSFLSFVFSGGAGAVAAIGLLAFIIWIRTKSTHILLTRLWSYFHGKGECKLPSVAQYFDEQAAIHQFRFTTGIRVRDEQQLIALLAFTKRHRLNVSDIAAVGSYFELDELQVKDRKNRPGKPALVAVATFIAALFAIVTVAIAAFSVDRAFLQMKATGTWFTLDQNYAKPFSDAPGFRLSACKDIGRLTPDVTGFSTTDRDAICRTFVSADTGRYVENSIHSQRWVLAIIAAFAAYFTIPVYGILKEAAAARKLEDRLTVRAEPSGAGNQSA